MPSLASTGSFFVTRSRSGTGSSHTHFAVYPPYADGRVKYIQANTSTPAAGYVDFSDSNAYDASSNVNGWKSFNVAQGTVAQQTIQASVNGGGTPESNVYWFQSDTPVVITVCSTGNSTWTQIGTDTKLLKKLLVKFYHMMKVIRQI